MNILSWNEIFEDIDFGDIRRNARVVKIANEIEGRFERSASSALADQASLKAASRFLNVETVTPEKLLSKFIEANFKDLNCKHVLVIQDTTELGFGWRKTRIEGLGPVTGKKTQGFFLHPGLIVNPDNESVLGLAAAKIWAREDEEDKVDKETRKKRPIEEKESYRWLSLPKTVSEKINKEVTFTVVADRESDIYELFLAQKNGEFGNNCELLIRAAQDRLIEDEEKNLFSLVDGWKIKGKLDIEVEATHKRKARKTKLEIRYDSLTLSVPNKKKSKIKENIERVFVIDVKEKKPPKGEEPIKWTLLTTREIKNLDDAIESIKWYKCRWFIEELFRILKSGYKVEKVKFDSGHALMNWCSLRLMMAVRIFYLLKQRENEYEDSAIPFFTIDEIKVLEYVEKKYISSNSQIHRPPKNSIAWAVLLLAIMGGYKAYPSAKPPGQETLWRGMDRLDAALIGFGAAFD